jgi:hypothetical protein
LSHDAVIDDDDYDDYDDNDDNDDNATVEWNRRSSSNPTKDPPNVLLHLLLMYVDRIFKLMMIQYIIILTSDYN